MSLGDRSDLKEVAGWGVQRLLNSSTLIFNATHPHQTFGNCGLDLEETPRGEAREDCLKPNSITDAYPNPSHLVSPRSFLEGTAAEFASLAGVQPKQGQL